VGAAIPEDVERFIAEHVHSVEQLEILLLLHRTRARAWSPDEIARELRIDAGSAASRLEDLRARGLVAANGSPTYVYAPTSLEGDSVVTKLATTYSERRVAVINLIFSKPAANIRSFADAFRLRKGD
jgi:predicted transcriptional regulator